MRRRLGGGVFGLFAFGLGLASAAEAGSWARAAALAREAERARAAGDLGTWAARATEAAELRPENPDFQTQRAVALAAVEQFDEALAALRSIAAAGLHPAGALTDLPGVLRARNDYPSVAKLLTANLLPRGAGEVVFSLRGVTGAIEALAVNGVTGEIYFGDGCLRTVWVRSKEGALRRFSAEAPEILGVMGLAWDGRRGALWAATAAVPEMAGAGESGVGRSALVELDAASGAVRRSWLLEPNGDEAHELRGVAVGADGTVWIVDRAARCLWRWREGAARPERVASDPEWLAPRGVVALDGGPVIVGDEKTGLHRVAADGAVTSLELPADTSLTGLTGMAGDGGDTLFVLQGDVRPTRVVRVALETGAGAVARMTVLEAAHLAMSAPAGAALSARGELYFAGNAGWGRVQGGPSSPRPVPVLRTRVAPAGR